MSKFDIDLVEIGGTSIEPKGGFSHLDILVAPYDSFDTIAEVTPIEGDGTLATTAIEAATIVGDHAFKTGKGFANFVAIQDKNGLESNMIGDAQAFENKLTIIVKGSDAATIGALRLLKSYPKGLIVMPREAGSGKFRQLGHTKYAARITEATAKIAPEYEGENTVMFVISDKNHVPAPFYPGTITKQPTA